MTFAKGSAPWNKGMQSNSTKICLECDRTFSTRRWWVKGRKYCSLRCAGVANRRIHLRTYVRATAACAACGKQIVRSPCRLRTPRPCCSKTCAGKIRRTGPEGYVPLRGSGNKIYWLRFKRPRPDLCELCLVKRAVAYHHWNDDRREIGMWICRQCHTAAHWLEQHSAEIYHNAKSKIEAELPLLK